MSLWMNTGTIAVTLNNKKVTGTGTAFVNSAIPARPGQPIVISNVIYEIESVESDTVLWLATNYLGASAADVKYSVMTTMEGSFNDLARRAAQVMGAYQAYMDVYNDLFTGTGNVTVTLPDGNVVTLPAWSSLQPGSANLSALSSAPSSPFGRARLGDEDAAAQLTALGASPFGRARLGDEDAAAARQGLDVPQFGRGKTQGTTSGLDWNSFGGFGEAGSSKDQFLALGIDDGNGAGPSSPGANYGAGLVFCSGYFAAQIAISSWGQLFMRTSYNGTAEPWVSARTTANTTVDANGFIKSASPVIHLYPDGSFDAESADGVSVARVAQGVYRVAGSLGFHPEGWYIEGPKDANGRMKFWLDYDQEPDGTINIRTTHREFTDGPLAQRNIVDGLSDGDPVDIPAGREITVRLSMPEPDRVYE